MYLFGTSLLCYIAFIIMFSIELLKLIIKRGCVKMQISFKSDKTKCITFEKRNVQF